ncbi:MAG: ABC transporter substrate-binding protein [Ethanoligenens sp.]
MKSSKKVLTLVMTALLTFSLVGCASTNKNTTSSSELTAVDTIKKAGVLKMATGNYAPFEYRDSKTNKIVGYDIDFAQRVAQKIGVKLEVTDMDFTSIIPSVQKGDYDMAIAAMYDTPERRKAVDMSDAYMQTGMVLVTLANNNTYKTLANLNGKRVGVKAGATSEKVANDMKTEKKYTYDVVGYKDTTGCIADLEAGRVDAVVNDQLNQLEINKTDSKVKIVGKPFTTSNLSAAVAKGNSGLLKVINETIVDMKKDGSAQKLYDKWIVGKA